ncbi:MAG: FlgD immunoglobulin-like domain containing protein [Candidatus Eisenbacteria bacterium]
MRRIIPLALIAVVSLASPLMADTFGSAPIAPDLGLDALNRGVARQQLGRDLFADPYATVTIGSVDVYDRFPYIASRTFQIVSDSRWNRLVFGEMGGNLNAFDGVGSPIGPLSAPRGLAVDEQDRLYVADSGNGRIVVFQATSEFGEMTLVPLYTIGGLARPNGVAVSDAGTPFDPTDDRLYVADTGRNQVVSFALEANGARQLNAIGGLGSGIGRFAGPMAVAVGRAEGVNTPDVYVADAHTRRLVHLRDQGGSLVWVGDVRHDADLVTSLDTDAYGAVYAAAPNQGVVRKFGPDLTPVAELGGGLTRPRGFSIPYYTVRDHRDGSVVRAGRPDGISLEQWSDGSGMRLWTLGVEVNHLAVTGGDAPSASFTLTDAANVSLSIDDASGHTLATRSLGAMAAGVHNVTLDAADLRVAGGGDHVLRLTASSRYPNGPVAVSRTGFRLGGPSALPSEPMLLGSWPNPAVHDVHIAFMLPSAAPGSVSLEVFDTAGRRVRKLDGAFAAGRNEVVWDGRDERGSSAPAGLYLYRLHVGGQVWTDRLALVR